MEEAAAGSGNRREQVGFGGQVNESTRIFSEYLKNNGLKLTSQRKLILDVFITMGSRVTVEELYHDVSEIDPGISLSTIYRAMKHLHRSGVARCVHYGDGTVRYEYVDGQGACVVCVQCGKRTPVNNPYLETMHRETARQAGFKMLRSQMTIFGLCHDCLRGNDDFNFFDKESDHDSGF